MSDVVIQSTVSGRPFAINKTAGCVLGCSIFVALMALGAYIRIPLFFTPVPITLQTLFVLLSGATLGRRWGALSQGIYVSLGIFGLPIFQGYGWGVGHLLGPTGGYLLGFIAASYAVGYLTENNVNGAKILLSMIAGLAIIYAFGIIWLKLLLGVTFSKALMLGLYPFIPGETVKLAAASSLYMGIKKRI